MKLVEPSSLPQSTAGVILALPQSREEGMG